ncbi:MAG: hypothetical protein JXQ30_01205, partial [Spirochaetes bacterium]|nr:hypothetical protein [Spirochaetota bacterium]
NKTKELLPFVPLITRVIDNHISATKLEKIKEFILFSLLHDENGGAFDPAFAETPKRFVRLRKGEHRCLGSYVDLRHDVEELLDVFCREVGDGPVVLLSGGADFFSFRADKG